MSRETPADRPQNILLDCVVATAMLPEAVVAAADWTARQEPPNSTKTHRLLATLDTNIAEVCEVSLLGRDRFQVVHTRGPAESATHIIVTAVRAFATRTRRLPHIVVCGLETSGPARCARALEAAQSADVTIVPLEATGAVSPDKYRRALRDNTCIATVAAVDLATGTRADIAALGKMSSSVPLFVDGTLLVGRGRIDTRGVAALSLSYASFGGPTGCGALVIRASMVAGYALTPHVFGDEATVVDGPLQGDPPNGSLAAAALTALMTVRADRRRKLKKLAMLHQYARTTITELHSGVRWAADAKSAALGILVFELPNHARSGPETQQILAAKGIHIGSVPTLRARQCVLRLGLWHGAAKKDIERAVIALGG